MRVASFGVAGNLCNEAVKRLVPLGIHNLVFSFDGAVKRDGPQGGDGKADKDIAPAGWLACKHKIWRQQGLVFFLANRLCSKAGRS